MNNINMNVPEWGLDLIISLDPFQLQASCEDTCITDG